MAGWGTDERGTVFSRASSLLPAAYTGPFKASAAPSAIGTIRAFLMGFSFPCPYRD
jgi:hypothetical protein